MISPGALTTGAGLLVLVFVVGYAVAVYNGLVRARNGIEKAWSNIDVVLRQRHDELPNLVETVKGGAAHESSTLEEVTRLRGKYEQASSIDEKAIVENGLNVILGGFLARVEAYPGLKANEAFLKLQSRISALESQIADRREYFNESVMLYNVRRERFPELLLSGLLGFSHHPYLSTPEAARAVVPVQFPKA
jgi:LemA protein